MICDYNDYDYEVDTDGHFEFIDGGPTVLCDGDPIAYSSASACDSAEHTIKLNGMPIYTVQGGMTDLYNALGFKDYREFNAMLDKNPDIEYDKLVTADDPEALRHTIKAQIKRLIKNTGAGAIKVFLTDSDSNFRLTENIATVLQYKGNRKADAKPTLLGEARRYMVEELGAIMVHGMEADDALAIDHRAAWASAMEQAVEFYALDEPTPEELEKKAMELSETVLATIDKDIKMCPGKFINPDQDLGIEEILPMGHLHLEVKKKENKTENKLRFSGLRGFYAQVLMGDVCDNIPGVYFCGDKSVYEVLKDCETEEQLFKATLREIYRGFHRKHLKVLDPEIMDRVDAAIASGSYGNDNPSNRTKVKKKIKTKLESTVAYGDLHYFHWSEYVLKEDGTRSTSELVNPEEAVVQTIDPWSYMIEVGRLVYMLDKAPAEDGSHLWGQDDKYQVWMHAIEQEFLEENLLRVEYKWDLPRN